MRFTNVVIVEQYKQVAHRIRRRLTDVAPGVYGDDVNKTVWVVPGKVCWDDVPLDDAPFELAVSRRRWRREYEHAWIVGHYDELPPRVLSENLSLLGPGLYGYETDVYSIVWIVIEDMRAAWDRPAAKWTERAMGSVRTVGKPSLASQAGCLARRIPPDWVLNNSPGAARHQQCADV